MNPTNPQETHPKKNLLIVSTFGLVIIVALCIGLFLKYANHSSTTDSSTTQDKAATDSQAKMKYIAANTLLSKGDYNGAKKAYEESETLYNQAGDTSHIKDIKSALSVITRAMSQQTVPPSHPTSMPVPAN